jgi:hypothetical protein
MTQRLTDPMQLKAPKRQRLTSVTTLIDQILPKPALVPWAERETAEGMLTLLRAGELHPSLTAHEALAAMREAKIGAEGVRTTAARRGVDVHALLERYARDGSWADPVGLLDVDDYPYAHALNDWLRKYRPEPHEIEQLVADPEHGYAGRLDLIATIDGQRTLVDLKSQERAGIYSAAHIQARAYERASVRCDGEPVDRVLIVVVAKDGTYREMDCLMTSRGFPSRARATQRIASNARLAPNRSPRNPSPPNGSLRPTTPTPLGAPANGRTTGAASSPTGRSSSSNRPRPATRPATENGVSESGAPTG